MEYKIYCEEKLIAEFENECDRDYCLDCLSMKYKDCEFIKEFSQRKKDLRDRGYKYEGW